MNKLNIYSLNSNGLGDKRKCQSVLYYFKSKKDGIVLLQETHMTRDHESSYEKWSGAKCLFAHGDSNSRGVAVLIYKKDVQIVSTIPDPNGRYLLVELSDNGTPHVILNIYAPTKDKSDQQSAVIDKIGELLTEHIDKRIVLGGDQNLCLDPDLDKLGGLKESVSNNALKLEGVLEHLDLVDIWRLPGEGRLGRA